MYFLYGIDSELFCALNVLFCSLPCFSMFSKLVSQGSQFVMEGVKNLVVKKHVGVQCQCALVIIWL